MAALEGLNPLKGTANRLLWSPRTSIEYSSRGILIEALYGVKAAVRVVDFVKELSESVGSTTMKVLEEEIKEAASGLEDALDSHVSDQTESIQHHPLLIPLDLEGVRQHVDGFKLRMDYLKELFMGIDGEEDKDEVESFMAGNRRWKIVWLASKAASMFLGMKAQYVRELDSLLPKANDPRRMLIKRWWVNKAARAFLMGKVYVKEELHNPSPEEEEEEDYGVPSTMVGLTDLFCEIRDSLLGYPYQGPLFIWGMAGLGKTALVIKILQDPLISSVFESRVFLRIGQRYEVQDILRGILAQLDPHNDSLYMEEEEAEDYLRANLWSIFRVRRILVVFDDVWDLRFWNKIRKDLGYFDNKKGSRFMMTTRFKAVARNEKLYVMQFLNNKESWDLLQEKVFAGEGEACPRELEKAGKQIAENCEGLPLLIITVADLLSKAEKTKEYWSKIASSKKNSIFTDAYEKISKVLYPSYYKLPHRLKTCFLYLGAFPQNSEIRISKLINLWDAEGLRNASRHSVMRDFDSLVSDSIALETQRSSYYHYLKACTLHSVFWYLSKREAWNEKFLHVLDSHLDASIEDIETRPRLSVYKNSILSIKAVHHSLASIPGVRSLLCTGPYHPYQVPICFYLRLLKVLDALTIRFYEFPLEVVKLVHLRYLALTCNGNLPPSISNLWNLQCLIVHQHQSIKCSKSVSYLPVEIWYLVELEYLQIMGRNLPDPPPDAVLKNLLTLLDVGTHTCTERVFESIPSLVKLRVQIELTPDATKPLSFLDEIFQNSLFSLQCVIVNPEIMFVAVAPPSLVSASLLAKLTLSGFGYPWKDIRVIAELPYLEVLKLRCYAFKGEEWKVGETEFQRLKYFLIEDTDLVEWTGGSSNFPELKYLTIKNCYKLQEIPQMPSVEEIRVVDSNPSALTFAKQMAPYGCCFYVDSSWLEKGKSKA